MGKKKKGKGYGSIVLTVALALMIAFSGLAMAEQQFYPGFIDKEGELGTNGKSWRIGHVNTVVFEGPTSNAFETYLSASDPSQVNRLLLPDESGTLLSTGGVAASIPLADTQMLIGQSTGLSAAKAITGDAGVTNAGVWTNDKIDNKAVDFGDVTTGQIQAANGTLWDSVAHTLSGDVTGTMDSAGDVDATIPNRYAEMYFHNHSSPLVTTLSAAALANVIGLTNGVATSGMTQNSTDGSITVAADGVFEFVGSMSIVDATSASEEYNGTVGIDGTNQEKCEWHTDITTQSKEEPASLSCLFSISAGEVVTFMVNSAGGDDAGWEAINWYIKEF